MTVTTLDSLSRAAGPQPRPRICLGTSPCAMQAESHEPATPSLGFPLLRLFDRMGCGGLILSAGGQVLARNAEAARILADMGRPCQRDPDPAGADRALLAHLLGRGRTRIRLDAEDWILIEREDRRPLILSVVPLPGEGGTRSVLMLIDLESAPLPSHDVLKRIFGLTLAESRLAIELARGATLAEAAKAHGVSVGTVRTQLGAIFAKTQTRRQAELMILVNRLVALG